MNIWEQDEEYCDWCHRLAKDCTCDGGTGDANQSSTLRLSRPMSKRGLYPLLSLPEGKSLAKWRKQCGLAITHMMARKTKALAMQFHHGATVGIPVKRVHGARV